MFLKIVGYFSIFLGVLWVIWPQLLRGWLVNKASGAIFWPVFFLYFFPMASLVGKWGANGWITALILFFILGSCIKSLIGKAASKIPEISFRAAGILNILSGALLVWLHS